VSLHAWSETKSLSWCSCSAKLSKPACKSRATSIALYQHTLLQPLHIYGTVLHICNTLLHNYATLLNNYGTLLQPLRPSPVLAADLHSSCVSCGPVQNPIHVAHSLTVAAAPQVYGSTRVCDDIATEEISMLTQLRGLKDLELD
jgi:hypothetical protein